MIWAQLFRFGGNKSGVIAVVIALAFVPMVLATGVAVDFTRAFIVKQKMAAALDAAGLAVGSSDPEGDVQGVLRKYYNTNFPAENLVTKTGLRMTIEGGEIRLAANARVETTFLRLVGRDFFDVEVLAQVTRETTGLEVVMVLDNTGSMARSGRIFALKTAANDLVDILFGDDVDPPNLKVGMVPFVTTVNIGSRNRQIVDFPQPDNRYPSRIDAGWKGCVEARPFPHDTLDTFVAGDRQRGEWRPYYWEAETYYAPRFGQTRRNSFCQNRWWRPSNPQPQQLPQLPRPTGRSGTPNFTPGSSFIGLDVFPSVTRGPNKACPDPMIPLTNDKKKLNKAILKMQPWSGNGTMVNLGAVWGWRLLSPGAPFTEGKPYGTEGNKKAIIIMTDGVNFFSGVSSRCRGTNPRYSSQYTGYGYLSEGRLDGARRQFAAQSRLNDRLLRVCNNIKEQDILVFTIVFQLRDARTAALFRSCATTPDRFFNSPRAEDLRTAFRAIGAELANLRVAR